MLNVQIYLANKLGNLFNTRGIEKNDVYLDSKWNDKLVC